MTAVESGLPVFEHCGNRSSSIALSVHIESHFQAFAIYGILGRLEHNDDVCILSTQTTYCDKYKGS